MSISGERRVIIVGKLGNGKSSLGNNLLRRKAFDEGSSFSSVTESCHMETKHGIDDDECDITIVDTPGLFRPTDEKSIAKQSLEILESLKICKNPHAFLLVIRNDSRLSQEDLFTKDAMEITFGPEFLQHTIVVITHVDNEITDTDFEEKWKTSEKLTSLIESCDKRVARIDNTDLEEGHLTAILSYINKVSEEGTKYYSYAFEECNRKILEDIAELGTFDNRKAHEQVIYISREMKKAIEREQFMTDINRKLKDLKDREADLFAREAAFSAREAALSTRESAIDKRKIQDDKMHQKRIDELNEMKRNAEEIIEYKNELARSKEAEGISRIKEAEKAEAKAKENVKAAENFADSIKTGALVATAVVGVAAAASGGITAVIGIGALKSGALASTVSLASHFGTQVATNQALKWLSKKKNS